jgi:hypothetical protein
MHREVIDSTPSHCFADYCNYFVTLVLPSAQSLEGERTPTFRTWRRKVYTDCERREVRLATDDVRGLSIIFRHLTIWQLCKTSKRVLNPRLQLSQVARLTLSLYYLLFFGLRQVVPVMTSSSLRSAASSPTSLATSSASPNSDRRNSGRRCG